VKRPSYKELNNKIQKAREAVLESRIYILDQEIIAADALEIGYLVKEISNVLSVILNEITPSNYAGQRPPQRSYEDKIKGCELFAFKWESKRFGRELYLKFVLKDGVNPIDCTKCDRVLDRINTPRGWKGSCHEIQEVHSGI